EPSRGVVEKERRALHPTHGIGEFYRIARDGQDTFGHSAPDAEASHTVSRGETRAGRGLQHKTGILTTSYVGHRQTVLVFSSALQDIGKSDSRRTDVDQQPLTFGPQVRAFGLRDIIADDGRVW